MQAPADPADFVVTHTFGAHAVKLRKLGDIARTTDGLVVLVKLLEWSKDVHAPQVQATHAALLRLKADQRYSKRWDETEAQLKAAHARARMARKRRPKSRTRSELRQDYDNYQRNVDWGFSS